MGADADGDFLGRLGPSLRQVLPMLDERSRRLVLGMAAAAAGDGGTGRVAALTGASWQTVADGKAEAEAGESAPPGRVRRPGGGRKRLAEADPGLVPALEALVRDSVRGDPESPLTWTTRSVKRLAGELAAAGHPCSPSTCWRALRQAGYTLQSNSKAAEGRQHPERDAQFRYIAAQAREHLAAGQPVISVDSKKREQVGNYGQGGRERAPQGDPVIVRSHDFPEKDGKHAIPYGVYGEGANAGFVNVGTDGNTAALAVESVRRWWQLVGRDAYPQATRLLVTADAGGSNACDSRGWKAGLAALAQEAGLDITVCHFPAGTSKWNKIEHRLFCQISLAWRGRPLTSYDVIISTIGAVTTQAGLTARAVLDENKYPTGVKVSDQQMKDLEDRCLTRHDWHGELNYTLLAEPRPAPGPGPEPGPPPARAAVPDPAALDHPAITGLPPGAAAALAAGLADAHHARAEARLHRRRGKDRTHPAKGRHDQPGRKLTYPHLVLAEIISQRFSLPAGPIAELYGCDRSTLSQRLQAVRQALAATATVIPPAGITLRTSQELRDYAAAAGITIPAPPQTATAPDDTLTTPATP
jgi:hypothetical protein